jgi:hypothetical protein
MECSILNFYYFHLLLTLLTFGLSPVPGACTALQVTPAALHTRDAALTAGADAAAAADSTMSLPPLRVSWTGAHATAGTCHPEAFVLQVATVRRQSSHLTPITLFCVLDFQKTFISYMHYFTRHLPIRAQDAALSEFETIFDGSDTDFLFHCAHPIGAAARLAFRVAGRCEHGAGAFGAVVVWSPQTPVPPPVPPPAASTALASAALSSGSRSEASADKATELSEKEVASRLAAARRAAGGNALLHCSDTARSALIFIVPLILSLLLWWVLQTPAPSATRSRHRF